MLAGTPEKGDVARALPSTLSKGGNRGGAAFS